MQRFFFFPSHVANRLIWREVNVFKPHASFRSGRKNKIHYTYAELSLASALFLWVQSLHQTSRVLTKRQSAYRERGPHSNCDQVFAAALSNVQNRHMENGTNSGS